MLIPDSVCLKKIKQEQKLQNLFCSMNSQGNMFTEYANDSDGLTFHLIGSHITWTVNSNLSQSVRNPET